MLKIFFVRLKVQVVMTIDDAQDFGHLDLLYMIFSLFERLENGVRGLVE